MRTIHLLRKYNPVEWGGTETALRRLLGGLRQQGVESVVLCPALDRPPDHDPLGEDGHQVERFRAFVPILGISSQVKRQLVSVGGNLMSFDLISMLRRQKEMSLIHTHALGRIGGIGLNIARQRRVPFLVTIHGGVLDLPPQVKKSFSQPVGGWDWGRFFGLIFQSHRLFPDADAIITCNAVEAGLLQERYPDKRIVVQPHGVPLETYQADQREHAFDAYPGLRGRQVLLCVGRIDPIKNQGWLIEQMPRIAQKYPQTILVLAGACTDEVYGVEVQQKIRALGIEDRVLLTGGLPPNDSRLIGLFQLADVLVVPSQSETFGLVILEAWATGTLVLSSRTSGARTLVREGENGWLFDLAHPQTFHEAFDNALAKPESARHMLRNGRDAVDREYNISALAARMKKLYAELIEEKHALRDSSRR